MGDVQEYFITNNVRNFYSVSISGYHIAEAGANPITQLVSLSNGFTYVEYYLSRGMSINDLDLIYLSSFKWSRSWSGYRSWLENLGESHENKIWC
jgi:methylmalonyl-CoA mutase N-terminal domain/subunit